MENTTFWTCCEHVCPVNTPTAIARTTARTVDTQDTVRCETVDDAETGDGSDGAEDLEETPAFFPGGFWATAAVVIVDRLVVGVQRGSINYGPRTLDLTHSHDSL